MIYRKPGVVLRVHLKSYVQSHKHLYGTSRNLIESLKNQWGADTAIADITTAAGWEILGCDPDALEQDVRIVCRGGNDGHGCGHLFSTPSGGASPIEHNAIGKIVRLPQNVRTYHHIQLAHVLSLS